jgi:hypothetical protein
MTGSTLTLTPKPTAGLGVGANTEPPTVLDEYRSIARLGGERRGVVDKIDTYVSALDRGARPDYDAWLRHVESAAGCVHPVRLSGRTYTVDGGTGEVLTERHTRQMPDAVIYKACGNRRSAVCPSCAEVYRADAYQLVLAGIKGGKGVPDTVTGHPAVFATATAPGFGVVHTQRTTKTGRPIPCRARRTFETCPHGVAMRCTRRHKDGDPALGQPLCRDCYDYPHHVVWNSQTGELWRRTAQQAGRLLDRHARMHGDEDRVRLSYGKVAEYQRRGVVHYHALIRLDGVDPDNPEVVIPPPQWANALVLSHVVRTAIETTAFYTKPHPANPDGWLITWGRQLDIRPLRLRGDRAITDTAVAGYLAKYATKSTDATGHVSKRITPATIDVYADDSHPGRLIDAAWTLGRTEGYERLIRWAHMLGFGGQFFSKSKRYSTTFKALRKVRTDWRRRIHRQDRVDTQLAEQHDDDTTIVINTLTYVGSGWHTTGDALLANTSAAMARERRRAKNDAFEAQVS